MRLSKFIQDNHEEITREWVGFASTLLPWARGMNEQGLRDHAAELLTALVSDMEAPQTRLQQEEKSQGLATAGALARVGHKHATQRLDTGFNLDQLVSEYRALRASILRLWMEGQGDQQTDVTRFNEAIDESLTEATIRYSEILDKTREEFLGILGHDLRNPLGAIVMGATLLTKSETIDDRQSRVATRILNSANRMDRMVSDLLDLTRSRLGSGIPITPRKTSLMALCEQVMAELAAVHPDCQLQFEQEGDLCGEWDGDRLSQVVSNLVANAVQYGGEGGVVRVTARGDGDGVVLQVHNEGPHIPDNALKRIFDPMVRQPPLDGTRNATGLGLGLYIAREIVMSHGGTIGVTSSEKEGTTFTVQLPRRSPNAHPDT